MKIYISGNAIRTSSSNFPTETIVTANEVISCLKDLVSENQNYNIACTFQYLNCEYLDTIICSSTFTNCFDYPVLLGHNEIN